jgi:hypothetical protein
VTKKSIKLPIIKVDCDDYVIKGEDGQEYKPREGEWLRLRKRLPARLFRLLLGIQSLQGEEDEIGEEEANNVSGILQELLPLLAQVIHSWNWTDIWDEERPALPPPTTETLWLLDIEEIFYLATKVMGSTTEAPNQLSSP